jgi:PAS domain S-box-containing protein
MSGSAAPRSALHAGDGLLAAQRRVMELIASGAALEEILTAIALQVEAMHADSLCSVLLLDASGDRLLAGAAPSLPADYNAAVHGLEIAVGAGSCGSAAALGERVVVEEIATHPWWADYRELAARAGLAACWSEPIRSGDGRLLGTFAVYHRRPHAPSAAEIDTLEAASRLAAVAIERERTREETRLSEERYRSLFENSPIGIYQSSREGRILAANPAFASLLGYASAAEVVGLRMAEDVYWDPAAREALIAVHGPRGTVADVDIVWKRKDGSPIEIRLSTSVLKDASGKVVAFEGFAVDVSEQLRNERSLRESEDRYRDLVEHSQDLICTHDLEGRILSINRWAAMSLGYDREELSQLSIRDLIAPEHRHEFDAYLEEVIRNGRARGRMLVETRGGERRIWEYDNSLRAKGVERPLVRGMGHDVTEHVRARRLQDAVYRISESGHAAASLAELFRSIHEIVGRLLPARNFYVALHDPETDLMSFPYFVDEFDSAPPPRKPRGLTGEVLRSGESLLLTPERPDPAVASGEPILGTPPIDWLGVPLRVRERTIGVLAVQSYTGEIRYTERDQAVLEVVSQQIAATLARKRAEEALRASEARYQRVVENIGDGLLMDDREGRVVFANDRFLELFGLERGDLDGLVLEDYVAPEHREALRDRHERRMRGEEVPGVFEYEGVRKDGSRIWVEVRVSRIVENGETIGTQSALRDVTASKRSEQERRALEDQLRHVLKMEAVGSLAGGVAHDFNNMLGVILGNTELALTELPADHPAVATLGQIRHAAERSIALTGQLLAFARKQAIRPRELDLNETIASMLKMLERLVGENLEIVWRPGKGLWPVLVDPVQVDQVLANLAVNARDAIHGSGTVSIATRNAVVGSAAGPSLGEPTPGEYVVVEVADTGEGMDEATRARIFEPFFTTKEIGRGTGMGLATVYGIVQQNRGAIEVESSPGAGTTFRIYLPRAERETAQRPAAAESADIEGTETILLVEDEAAVLELSRQILTRAGFTVLTARTPDEALALVEGGAGPIELLLTDVMLPGMSGRELKERLDSFLPGLRCLYISGYTADVIAHRGVLEADVHFLGKPFTMRALVAKVRDVLDG